MDNGKTKRIEKSLNKIKAELKIRNNKKSKKIEKIRNKKK